MRIGFLSLPLSGHLNPMTALARNLQSRGYEVEFFGLLDNAAAFRDSTLQFMPYAEEECPLGFVAQTWAPVTRMHGMDIIRYAFEHINPKLLGATLLRLPDKIKASRIEGMVIDAAFVFSELVPLALEIPFAQTWLVLHPDPSARTPPSTTSWPDERTPEALERNARDLQDLGGLFALSVPVAATFAKQYSLEIDWQTPGSTSSRLAVITQTPQAFDFPEVHYPGPFHYTGPFTDNEGRTPISFDWEKLDERPLVYASLGTLTNGLTQIHKAILATAAHMPEIQLVFSIGANVDAEDLGPFPPNAVVVTSAPQLALLKRACLCITHAGLNTALEALSEGVPMVAIPVGYDQPGVASRIVYHGVGVFIEVNGVTPDSLQACVQHVLNTPSYRDQARSFQKILV